MTAKKNKYVLVLSHCYTSLWGKIGPVVIASRDFEYWDGDAAGKALEMVVSCTNYSEAVRTIISAGHVCTSDRELYEYAIPGSRIVRLLYVAEHGDVPLDYMKRRKTRPDEIRYRYGIVPNTRGQELSYEGPISDLFGIAQGIYHNMDFTEI